jgi:cellobiose-specific phosphotransferase system component IIB
MKAILEQQIKNAKDSKELQIVIESMPNTQLKRVLDDAFWYIDLVTVEQQKEFMLKRINFYN